MLRMRIFQPMDGDDLEELELRWLGGYVVWQSRDLNMKISNGGFVACGSGSKGDELKKGIKGEFSIARLHCRMALQKEKPDLIEAARTMLADSLLPIPFWAEAVNTACYVLNRVLVTKPQNKTPYELLIDSLGKFDGKSDEGYLLGYSTSSKAFRVYNKRTKRVEENLHINFLEDQPNVTGTGPNWMFDLDFLTNSMNYIPVSVENQVNVDAGTQDSYVAGSSGKDKGPTQEYILLPLQPHRTRIPVEDVPPAAHEKPSESSPKDNDVQDTEDAADKEEQHQMKESEQDLQDELEKMVTQELAAKAMDDVSRQAFEEEKRRIASQKKAAQATSTNILSTDRQSVSTDRPSVSTDRPSVSTDRPFVSTDRPSVSTDRPFVSTDRPSVSIASTPTGTNAGESSFVYLGGKIPIDASTLPNADTLIKICLTWKMLLILSQMMEYSMELMMMMKMWVQWLISTTWITPLLNKRDEISIFVKNKARLVAQGFRQEKGIDYDEVFAPVAKIKAIRIFLAFASYMGFTVYQMDVKSAFLYGTIEEEVYVYQPPGFVDPAHPNKVYKVIKALYGLHQAPKAWFETLSSFLMENGFKRGTIDKTMFIMKRKSGHVKMIARKRPRPQPDDDSDDEHRKCLRIITFDSTIDSEIMETKSLIARLYKVSSPDGNYLVIYRVNRNFRAFNYIMEVLHIFDLVMKQYLEITLEDIELIHWGG
ncbi:putative ribonuclease H-like domain-containing protein [Tanacetum coccineum]